MGKQHLWFYCNILSLKDPCLEQTMHLITPNGVNITSCGETDQDKLHNLNLNCFLTRKAYAFRVIVLIAMSD